MCWLRNVYSGLPGESEESQTLLVDSCGVNTCTMTNFELSSWCHWARSWERISTVRSREPVWAGSGTARVRHPFCFHLWPGLCIQGWNVQEVVVSWVISQRQEETKGQEESSVPLSSLVFKCTAQQPFVNVGRQAGLLMTCLLRVEFSMTSLKGNSGHCLPTF